MAADLTGPAPEAAPRRVAQGPQRGTAILAHERRFYAQDRAIGRFGMRIFKPSVMPEPHWHGHVEGNFLTGARMIYRIEDQEIEVPPGRLVLFWAGIPHQLVELIPEGEGPARLTNIYLPVDAFLFMPHIAELQMALLGGGIAVLSPDLVDEAGLGRWYRDYRSNDVERTEVMKMEMNALMRRALVQPLDYLRAPLSQAPDGRSLTSVHVRHVVAMIRFLMENLASPLRNADVAAVTGLHENYALTLFSRIMRVSLKKFIIRMRLMRARALLMESSTAIAVVAEQSGFQSISQFYAHFRAAYGLAPHAMRARYRDRALV